VIAKKPQIGSVSNLRIRSRVSIRMILLRTLRGPGQLPDRFDGAEGDAQQARVDPTARGTDAVGVHGKNWVVPFAQPVAPARLARVRFTQPGSNQGDRGRRLAAGRAASVPRVSRFRRAAWHPGRRARTRRAARGVEGVWTLARSLRQGGFRSGDEGGSRSQREVAAARRDSWMRGVTRGAVVYWFAARPDSPSTGAGGRRGAERPATRPGIRPFESAKTTRIRGIGGCPGGAARLNSMASAQLARAMDMAASTYRLI